MSNIVEGENFFPSVGGRDLVRGDSVLSGEGGLGTRSEGAGAWSKELGLSV